MAVFSRGVGSAITLGAAAVAVLALFAPLPDTTPHTAGGSPPASCPMGYSESDGVPLPEHHPPVAQRPERELAARRGGDGSTLYTNAVVWTGDAQVPWADSFSVSQDGRILDVGRGGLLPVGGYPSSVVDLNGRFVAPGLIDAHIHLLPGGLSLRQLDLSRVDSVRGFTDMVEQAVAEQPGSREWLLGRGWNNDRWGGVMPRASWIDQVTMERPVLLLRYDLHCGVANSAALRLAGLTPGTPDPPGGVIERDADGSLTGLLKDSAISLINSLIPAPSEEENKDALDRAMNYFAAQGVTAVHDMGRADFLEGPDAAWRDFENVLLPAANDGRLKIRVHSALPLVTRAKVKNMAETLGWSHPGGFLSWGTVKAFADGSLGSRTAKMWEPYSDVESTGIWVTNMTRLKADIMAADADGMQVAVHAIGDQAVDELLTYFKEARRVNGPRDASLPRHRIEHAQHITGAESVSSMAAAGVQVVTNPLHLLDDRHIIPQCLGAHRGAPSRAFPQQSYTKAGVPVACGSDWPVVDANALLSIYAGVYRRAIGEEGSHEIPSGGMTMEEALLAHTSRADSDWFAGVSSGKSGKLAAGFLADFVVLSHNPLSGHDSIANAQVLQTFVGGKCVFNASRVN